MRTPAPLQNAAVKPQQSSHLGLGRSLLKRQCSSGSPTSSLSEECSGCGSKQSMQTKLTIGATDDPMEREADRVAAQVLAAPLNSAISSSRPHIQRYSGQTNGRTHTVPASVDRVLASSGRPLEPSLRQEMEERFGHDFSRVRVHVGSVAEESALQVNANAYTVENNIVFGTGRFVPETHEGRHLIAHELTHVVQQSSQNRVPGAQSRGKGKITRGGGRNLAEDTSVSSTVLARSPILARQMRTPNLQSLTGPELQAEHTRVREWLSLHRVVEVDYPSTAEYFVSIEAEVARRDLGSAPPIGGPDIRVAPDTPALTPPGGTIKALPGPRGQSVPPPGVLFSGPRSLPSDAPARITASHAGGALGERELPFALGEQGVHLVITAVGPGSHSLTGNGFDAIGWNPSTRELWLIDNKSTNELGKLEGKKATALGVNLESSFAEAVPRVRSMPDFPDKGVVLDKLEKAWEAVRQGKSIPSSLNVKLKLTNAGGYGGGKGVGGRNLPPQTTMEDLVSPAVREARSEDVSAAKVNDANPTRPRSHDDTEAMREKVGGVQSREPIIPSKFSKVKSGARVVGGGLARIGAILVWNYGMSKLDNFINGSVTDRLVEQKLMVLEPVIAAALNDETRSLANLQLSGPGKALFGNISVLVTIHWSEGEDSVPIGAEARFVAVAISSEKIERNEHSRIWTRLGGKIVPPPKTGDINILPRAPRDEIRGTYSVELEHLKREELQAILEEQIEDLELTASRSSSTPEDMARSQRRRSELSSQLQKLNE